MDKSPSINEFIMRKCPNCNSQIDDNSQFCTECGKPIVHGIFCPHCGAYLDDGNEFCSKCGNPIGNNTIANQSESSLLKCPFCGANTSKNDVCCPYCGKRFDEIPIYDKKAPYYNRSTRKFSEKDEGKVEYDYELEENNGNLWRYLFYVISGILILSILFYCWRQYDNLKPNKESLQDNAFLDSIRKAQQDSLVLVVEKNKERKKEEIKEELNAKLEVAVKADVEAIQICFSNDFKRLYNKVREVDGSFLEGIWFWSRSVVNPYEKMVVERVYDIEGKVAYADIICSGRHNVTLDEDNNIGSEEYHVKEKAKLVNEGGKWVIDDYKDYRKFFIDFINNGNQEKETFIKALVEFCNSNHVFTESIEKSEVTKATKGEDGEWLAEITFSDMMEKRAYAIDKIDYDNDSKIVRSLHPKLSWIKPIVIDYGYDAHFYSSGDVWSYLNSVAFKSNHGTRLQFHGTTAYLNGEVFASGLKAIPDGDGCGAELQSRNGWFRVNGMAHTVQNVVDHTWYREEK